MSFTSDPGDLPTAGARQRRKLPLVWLVPIFSALVAAWLAWDTVSKRGPTITVSFESAEGLQVNQSKLKFLDVEMGTVTGISVAPDHTKVFVAIETKREAESMLGEKTIFWVVKPGLFAGRISGLDTLLSGSYVQMLPPVDAGRAQRNFVGLEEPPVLLTDKPGTTFELTTKRIGSISVGSPVFFRGMTVGTVLGWKLGDLADSVTIKAFVNAPFDKFVHETTHFWNASGISVKLGGGGVRVEMESVKALLLGGIAFDLPVIDEKGAAAAAGATFPLYADADEAEAAGYGRQFAFISTFAGAVGGLSVGADVTLHGLRIGDVTDVGLHYDPVADRVVAEVRYRIQPERIAGMAAASDLPPGTIAVAMVKRGLRATLQSSNLLTGQQVLAMDFFPDAPAAELTREGDVFVVPVYEAGGFESIARSAGDLLNKINRIDFEAIGKSVVGITGGLDGMVNGPQLKQTLTSLEGTMSEAQDVMKKLDAGAGPAMKRLPEITLQLQETLTKANRMIGSFGDGYGADSKFLRDLDHLMPQLTDAVRSIRALADLLQRHPEALVRGRTDTGAQ